MGKKSSENNKSSQDIKSISKTSKKIFSYLANYRSWFIVSVLCMFVRCGGEIVFNVLNKPLMNSLIAREGAAELLRIVLMMAGIGLTIFCAHLATNRISVRLSVGVTKRMRQQLCEHLHHLPMSYFNRHNVGEIMSNFSNDVTAVDQILSDTISTMIESTIIIVGTALVMLWLSPVMAVIVWAIMSLSIAFSHWSAKFGVVYYRDLQKKLADVNGYVEEMISGQKVVKTHNFQKRSIRKFAELNEELREINVKAVTIPYIVMWVNNYSAYFYFVIIAFAGLYFAINQMFGVDFGTVIAILQLTRSFSRPVTMISTQLVLMINGIAGAERIFDLLEQPYEPDQGKVKSVELSDKQKYWLVPEGVDLLREPQELSADIRMQVDKVVAELYPDWINNQYRIVPAHGDIEFNDVDFSYETGKPILKKISFHAEPNQRIALVGTTGSGKTTLVNLVNRFYEIEAGQIWIDGIYIHDIEKYHLRLNIGMVTQNIHHFAGTIRDNIRFGNWQASEEEIVAAAKLANAHSFIERLPGGYDFCLTADGNNLSQGERQLLAIARVALINPLILILDEATSSVDTRTEQLISQGMDKLMIDKTVIAIAHRLSTVYNSNAILIMEHGEIIERGTHDELMALGGRYFALSTGRAILT